MSTPPPNTLYYGDNLDILAPSDMLAYLSMMALRLLELRRVAADQADLAILPMISVTAAHS